MVIQIPPDLAHLVEEGKNLRIAIEFSLEKPQGGVHFVVPNCPGTLVEVNKFKIIKETYMKGLIIL